MRTRRTSWLRRSFSDFDLWTAPQASRQGCWRPAAGRAGPRGDRYAHGPARRRLSQRRRLLRTVGPRRHTGEVRFKMKQSEVERLPRHPRRHGSAARSSVRARRLPARRRRRRRLKPGAEKTLRREVRRECRPWCCRWTERSTISRSATSPSPRCGVRRIALVVHPRPARPTSRPGGVVENLSGEDWKDGQVSHPHRGGAPLLPGRARDPRHPAATHRDRRGRGDRRRRPRRDFARAGRSAAAAARPGSGARGRTGRRKGRSERRRRGPEGPPEGVRCAALAHRPRGLRKQASASAITPGRWQCDRRSPTSTTACRSNP